MSSLTPKMEQALHEARAAGYVFAGTNVDRRGRVSSHAASTLRALASRRLLQLSIGPDGGMCGTLTKEGDACVTLLASGNALLASLARRDYSEPLPEETDEGERRG